MAFDPVWQFVSAILVAFAILGVGWRAAGLVRLRNSADMAVGIFAVLVVSVLAYWALGHGLQFGTSAAGLVGTTGFLPSLAGADGATLTRHALFSAFVAVVVASAAGERLRLPATIALGVFAGAVLQPIAGHWIGAGPGGGWLAGLGFFGGGAAALHVLAGAAALAVLAVAGPRLGRIAGKPGILQAHAIPFAVLGTVLVGLGLPGLAGHAAPAAGSGLVGAEMLLAGAAGGTAALAANLIRPTWAGLLDILNGMLAGMVAASAVAGHTDTAISVAIGAIGGLIAPAGRHMLEAIGIDDAAGLVPVHLFGGLWGAIAPALMPLSVLPDGLSPVDLIGVQVLGAAAIGAFAFAAQFLAAAALKRAGRLRVDGEAERRGLDRAVHGLVTDAAILSGRLGLYRKTADLTDVLDSSETDFGDVAREFNRAVQRFRGELSRARRRFSAEAGTGPARVSKTIEREEDELRIAAQEVNLVCDQIVQAAPLIQSTVAPRQRFLRALQATFEVPLGDLADLERRLRSETDETELERLVETARERSAGLARKLAGFVDFADAASAEAPPSTARFDLRGMIADTVVDFSSRAHAANVMIAWSVDEGAGIMRGHPGSMRKILRRLVDNAIRYNQDGGLVEIAARVAPGGGLQIEVADTGCGMNEAQVRTALDPFGAEAAGATRFGFGLALVDRLAALHGGRLRLDSRPRSGTRAILDLPDALPDRKAA